MSVGYQFIEIFKKSGMVAPDECGAMPCATESPKASGAN